MAPTKPAQKKPRRFKPKTSKGTWFSNAEPIIWNGIAFASKFERDFAQQLDKLGMKWEYESDTFYWFPTPRLYKPDFKIFKEDGSHYYIETKGFFDPESRAKMAAIKKQFPEEDIRMTFMDPNKKISKAASGKTYCEWCDKHGYPWSSFCLPQDWRNNV